MSKQAQQHIIWQVRALLVEAAEAHHDFEENELAGVPDQDWPAWYASYLHSHGLAYLIDRSLSEAELGRLLQKCDEEYRRNQPAEEWPDYYARRIASSAGT